MSQPVVGADYVTCELVASTSAGATTLLVSTPTNNFPTLGAGEYFYITIVDEASYQNNANPPVQREIVKVPAYSTVSTGYQFTGCTRGVGNTTAQIWASGSICEIRPCEIFFQDLKGGDGSAWAITDGVTTVTDVENLFIAGGVVSNLGANAAGVTTAPPGASYLTLGTNSTLTNERVLTAGTNITFTDGGAGSTLTINASGGSGGSTSQSQTFLSSGTFTPDSGVTAVWVTMIGGGGGGGSIASSAGGGGGGSGEYCISMPVAVSGAVTVTVGAGGAAGNASAGGNGGDTSFGSSLIARGGKGGSASSSVSGAGGGTGGGAAKTVEQAGVIGSLETPVFFGGSSGGGGGGATPNAGAAGGPTGSFPTGGAGGAVASSQGGGGGGGNSPFGLGGAGGSNGNGSVGAASGAGGGGASGKSSGNYLGGAGADGMVMVTWIAP